MAREVGRADSSGRSILIGVDESGLGAWAGPATACAVAVREDDSGYLYDIGIRDSKLLSDNKRRMLVPQILELSMGVSLQIMTVEDLSSRFRDTWRTAMLSAAMKMALAFPDADVILDGSIDRSILKQLRPYVRTVRFVTKADRKFPVVGAASIIAKTCRNDRMLALCAEYPEYGWDQNSGYHSKEHLAAILSCGITPAHRRIRPIRRLLLEQKAKERK